MADIFSPTVLENLIKLITDEAILLSGVKDEVILLQSNLGFMNAFLKKSAKKQSEDELVKELVNQIRDVALRAEDAIDTYRAEAIKRESMNLLEKIFHSPGHAIKLHKITDETSKIKETLDSIKGNKEEFNIGEAECSGDAGAQQSLYKWRRNVEEDEVVGFTDHTTKLVDQLTDSGRLRREVISIVGMGGLGKTTLAKKIYNNTRVKNRFRCCAWVSVSQEYNMNRLLIDILKLIDKASKSDEINQMSDEELKIAVCDKLKGKRYFVVMDDIWTTQVWDDIKGAFPDESNGSRILITSREKEVALVASPSTAPYQLPFLDKDPSWKLLQKKVFRGEECPPNLESLGRELAENCKGLPLAIVLLSGILAKKEKSYEIWSRFVGCVRSYITEDSTPCLDILALSYDHLPSKLKPCFLYFGMFPEDYVIQSQDLIKLWKAERLVQQIGNRKVDSVAEDYLEELIDRSLIQVAVRRRDGTVKACRIHDLLRDLCIKKSEKEKFFDVCSEAKLSSFGKPRRLSIHCDSVQFVSRNACDASSTRSLVFFCQEGDFKEKEWEWIWKNFKFIQVLTLMDVRYVDSFPMEMEKLIFLRHLSMRNTMKYTACVSRIVSINRIPDYICKLPYLETIDIQLECRIEVIRAATFNKNSIWRMKQLRHLNVFGGFRILHADQNQRENDIVDDTLWNLQVVHCIKADKSSAHFISKSPNLTELTLYYSGGTDKIEVAEVLKHLENLQYLQKLKLRCFYSYPHLQVLPSSLTKITLKCSFMDSHLMEILGKLPKLRQLKAKDTKGRISLLIAGEFPELQVFELYNCHIAKLEVEGDTMPNLDHLYISYIKGGKDVVSDQLWLKMTLRFAKIHIDFDIVDCFVDNLRKSNCVMDVRESDNNKDFSTSWEFTKKNGSKVFFTSKDYELEDKVTGRYLFR